VTSSDDDRAARPLWLDLLLLVVAAGLSCGFVVFLLALVGSP
jgi:hypothetical protein